MTECDKPYKAKPMERQADGFNVIGPTADGLVLKVPCPSLGEATFLAMALNLAHDFGASLATAALAERDKRIAELEHDVANEQHDIGMLTGNISKVYDHVTGGRISKPNTMPYEVITESDAYTMRLVDEAVKEATAERDAEIERLRDTLKTVKAAMEVVSRTELDGSGGRDAVAKRVEKRHGNAMAMACKAVFDALEKPAGGG